MNNIQQNDEIIAALNHANGEIESTYKTINEVAKNMSHEQLLELMEKILYTSKEREKALTKHIIQSNNPELAMHYTHNTQAYINNIYDSTTSIVRSGNEFHYSDMFR